MQCKLELKNKKGAFFDERFFSALRYTCKRLLEGKARSKLKKDWESTVSRLAPVSWEKGYGVDKYRQPGRCPHLNEAANKYPGQNCTKVQFC